MSKRAFLIGWALFLLSATGFSNQLSYIEILKPQSGILKMGVDRTASTSHNDIAKGLTSIPQLDLRWAGFTGGSGLFAGGKVKLGVSSYQMWLINHPTITNRKEIPNNTENLTGKFELYFLAEGGEIIKKNTVVADYFIQSYKEDSCDQCNDYINPAYASLETEWVDIPLLAATVKVSFICTVDLITGEENHSLSYDKILPIVYHNNPNPVHIRGKSNFSPYNIYSPQFSILEAFKLKVGISVELDNGGFLNSRPSSFIFGNTPIRQAYEKNQVCYDKKNPSRVHYSNGNDVRLENQILYYRIDKKEWKQGLKTSNQVYEIPSINGKKLEIAFAYTFINDLNKGLYDINRCYQIGSDFEWVPSKPGVSEINLGVYYDSPSGDLSEGWEIEFE